MYFPIESNWEIHTLGYDQLFFIAILIYVAIMVHAMVKCYHGIITKIKNCFLNHILSYLGNQDSQQWDLLSTSVIYRLGCKK